MLKRAWWAGLLIHVRWSWQQQGEGARVGGGTRADVACAGDAILGFHQLHWKHDAMVLLRSCCLMFTTAVKVVGSQRAPGEILHWSLQCRQ
jgi:hypothetical protein